MLEVVAYPAAVLAVPALAVVNIDQLVKITVSQMTEAMYLAGGVGLAAPQVGRSERIIVIDHTAGNSSNALLACINPRVVWASPEQTVGEEGCLSLPGVSVMVPRSAAVDVEYLDTGGELRSRRLVGYEARILQHEVDHLDGIVMIDRTGPLSRRLALKELKKR